LVPDDVVVLGDAIAIPSCAAMLWLQPAPTIATTPAIPTRVLNEAFISLPSLVDFS